MKCINLYVEKARPLIVECAEDLLANINACEKLIPYLRDYPFSINNIEISIFSFEKGRKRIFHPLIEFTTILDGNIIYSSVDPENDYQYKARIIEPYEEALAIIKEMKK